MLYGVIDIGSNTIRLMIYRVDNGAIHPVLNNKFAAGLAGYITAKGKMSKEGIRKAVEVLTELRTVTEQITLDGVFPFGTAPCGTSPTPRRSWTPSGRRAALRCGSFPARRKRNLTTTAPFRARLWTADCWWTWAAAARSWCTSPSARRCWESRCPSAR